jgi:hypothetical protein
LRRGETRRLVGRISVAALLAASTGGLFGCGGGGGGGGPTTSTPVPQRRQIAAFNFTLAADFDLGRGEFTTTATGTLEAQCDWTFASNDIDIGIFRGSCSFSQFIADQCSVLVESISTTAKPERVTASNAPAGTYTLMLLSVGNTAESGNCQIYLTS